MSSVQLQEEHEKGMGRAPACMALTLNFYSLNKLYI